MTAIRHSANAGRARVRLISTNPGRDDMSSTIAGIRFSDQLAALLDHAIAHGWRIEPDTKGTGKPKPNAVVAYSPDKDVHPIAISERGGKFNKPHYENIRRDLYRSGLPPLPADVRPAAGGGVIIADSAEEALAKARDLGAPPGARVHKISGAAAAAADAASADDMPEILQGENGPQFLSEIVEGLMKVAGLGPAESELVSTVSAFTMAWTQQYSTDRIHEGTEALRGELEARYQKQVDDALELAARYEKEAATANRAADRAADKERQARDDCGAAIRRAEAAEAKARELEAAIAPLRAVLAPKG